MSDAPHILSLDVATHTGVADGCADVAPAFYTLDFSSAGGRSHAEVFAAALKWVAGRLAVDRPDFMAIEAPLRMGAASGQTNADTVLRLYGLYAIFAAAARVRGIRLLDVNVQDARGGFLGNRTVPRDTAKARALAMCEAIGWRPNNLDEADAGAVHWHAMRTFAPKFAPYISPLMHHQIATRVEQDAIAKASSRRQRSIEIADQKIRRAERKAALAQQARSLFERT